MFEVISLDPGTWVLLLGFNVSFKVVVAALMVYMGRNLISKTTEGIWTKREPTKRPA